MADFNYIISVTGDCQSTSVGAMSLSYTGGTEPYTTEWIFPYISYTATTNPAILTNLSADTYVLRVVHYL